MITQQDAYIWSVLYKDGSVLCEYDEQDGRAFAEVGDKPVEALDIEPVLPLAPPHRVLVPEGATPVFFRRRSIVLNPMGNGTQQNETVHCIGWRRDDRAVYLFVFADGRTLLSNDLQAV